MRLRIEKIPFLLPLVAVLCVSGTAGAADFLLLVAGPGGAIDTTLRFQRELSDLEETFVNMGGYHLDRVFRAGYGSVDQTPEEGGADLVDLQKAFEQLAADMTTSDTLLVVLNGHGQSDFIEPKFNLKGPDLTPAQLGAWLERIPARDQRLILSFPCSGHFCEFLTRPARSFLASCDGPREIYGGVMMRSLLTTLNNPSGDPDGDGEISLHELFNLVSYEVAAHYVSRKLIQTEHPALEDNGDGRVTTLAEGMDAGDGEWSRTIRIVPAPTESTRPFFDEGR